VGGRIVKKRLRRLWLALAIAALNAAAAAAVGLNTARVVKLPGWLLGSAVCVVAVTAVLGSALTAFREFRGATIEELRKKLATALRVALCTLAVHTRLGTCDFGISVWTLRRRPPLVGSKVLRPVFRQRAVVSDGPSGVKWQPGKGTHGLCVQSGAYVPRDLGADCEKYKDAAWHIVPEEARQGMADNEFHKVVGRYRFAAAAPLVQQVGNREETIGCVMLDVPRKGNGTRLQPGQLEKLMSEEVEQLLKGAAGLVVNHFP
jgi:hypothetical protein